MKNFSATILFVIIIQISMLAQSEDWVNFTKENSGLPTNSIRQVVQDKKGIYWIATVDSGLVRFDGKAWKVFNTKNSPLPHDYVYSIAFDKNNHLWIGTYGGGLVYFDGVDSWKIYNQKNSGLTCDWIYCVTIDRESKIWIGTSNGGLNIFDGRLWKNFTPDNSSMNSYKVTFIFFDKKNNAWIGTGASLYRIIKGKWKIDKDFGLNTEDHSCYWITSDQKGDVFFCYKFGAIVKYNWKKFQSYEPNNSCIPYLGYYSITIDQQGTLWAGSFGHGLLRMKNGECNLFTKGNSVIKDNLIFNVQTDNRNNKWISTFSSGIFVCSENKVRL